MMQQDPNKDIQKPSVKEKLARSSTKKKVGVGEMGKPSLKAKFEAAMQKKFDSDNKKKLPKDNSESLTRMVKNVKEEDGSARLTRMVKNVREEDKSQDVGKFREWTKKESIRSARENMNRDIRSGFIKAKEDMVPDMSKEDIQKYIKSATPYKYKKPLKSMSKNKLKY
jgi:hypothetical protein